MIIFVKVIQGPQTGSKFPFDIPLNTQVQSLKALVAAQISPSTQATDVFLFGHMHKPLKDDLELGMYNIRAGDTLEAQILEVRSYDPEVEPVLKKDLEQLAATPRSLFVFISLGSYDNGHNDGNVRLRHQQCPNALFQWCNTHQFSLRILLIDQNFATPEKPQIYDIDQNWQRMGEVVKGEKIRRYRYQDRDHEIWTYGTDIPDAEYQGRSLTLAGLDLNLQFKNPVEQHNGAVVIGDIDSYKVYVSNLDSSQLQTLGILNS